MRMKREPFTSTVASGVSSFVSAATRSSMRLKWLPPAPKLRAASPACSPSANSRSSP